MIYKTLTEIRQSELNADCGKGFSRCCLTEQDSYTGRASVPALWESINCEGISIGSLQIMKALIARGWTVIGVEIARTDVEKRATLTLQEGYRRPGLPPPPPPPSGCENSFSSCNEGKATRDNLHRKEGMDRPRELVQLRLLPNCRSVPQGGGKIGRR